VTKYWTAEEAYKDRKDFSFEIDLCSDPHLWSWIISDDWKNTDKRTDGRDGIFAKSPRCDISLQGAQVCNPWSPQCQQDTSPNRKIPAVLVRPCISRMSQKRATSVGLQSTPTGKRPRWCDYMSDLVWCRLGVETAELCENAVVDREVFQVLLGLLPPWISPKEKQAPKWVKEWVCRPTLNPSVYKIMFSLFAKSKCRIQIIKHTWTETCVFVKISSTYQTYCRRENGADTTNLNHVPPKQLKKNIAWRSSEILGLLHTTHYFFRQSTKKLVSVY